MTRESPPSSDVRPAEGGSGVLYLVSTPIGNLSDMTPRAIDVLKRVDLVLCEDTRHSRPLLDAFEVRTSTAALHEHNEAKQTAHLLDRLREGQDVALISDAGTPLVSDPGARLVRAAVDAGVRVVPVPGASAVMAAVVSSGLVEGPFTFYGFLPRRGGERKRALEFVSKSPFPVVLYEAANRVADTLGDLGAERSVAVARELTKLYEEVRRGTAGALASYYGESPPRGEVVIVVSGVAERDEVDAERIHSRARELRALGESSRDIARAIASEFGVSRNDAYALTQELGNE